MTTLRDAATQALEALEQSETFVPYEGFGMARRKAESKHQAAITALRAALAEPVQESKILGSTVTEIWNAIEYAHDLGGPLHDRIKKLVEQRQNRAQPVQEPVAYSVGRTLHWHEGKGGNDAQLYLAPPQRKPLTETSAERTLKRLGYTDCGGEFWKPPLGAPAEPEYPLGQATTDVGVPVYVLKKADNAPPQRKPLTEQEIWHTYKNLWMFHPAEEPRLAGDVLKFARAIERAHGIV